MKKTVLSQTIGSMVICMSASMMLVACGGGGAEQSHSKLLPQTGCAGASCYGYNVVSTSSLQFYVNSASWADLHYTVNGGGQNNVRMTASGGNNTYTVVGLKAGDVVRYFFTIANSTGGATDSAWLQYTMGGTAPAPAPTPTPTPAPTPTPTPAPTPTPTPTPTPAGCTYKTWASGTNYPLGTIVKYPANGNFYKEVNAGTNGSDGTDPTISTWYWAPTTCSGATPTPTPAPTPTPTPTGGFTALSQTQFNAWFPNRNPFYQYADFVAATAYYPSFAKSGNATLDKQEVAAFFANLQHESDQLKAVREYNTANYGSYCDVNWVQVACKSTNWNDQYFGRGPIQISWTSNYRALGNALGLGEQLVTNPEMLATNATIAWRSALWYWMTQNGRAAQPAHAAMVNGIGFGQTINAINGFRECVGGSAYQGPAQMQTRVNFYTTFTQNLGVPTGPNTTC